MNKKELKEILDDFEEQLLNLKLEANKCKGDLFNKYGSNAPDTQKWLGMEIAYLKCFELFTNLHTKIINSLPDDFEIPPKVFIELEEVPASCSGCPCYREYYPYGDVNCGVSSIECTITLKDQDIEDDCTFDFNNFKFKNCPIKQTKIINDLEDKE